MMEFIAGSLLSTALLLIGLGVYIEAHKPHRGFTRRVDRPRWEDIARK